MLGVIAGPGYGKTSVTAEWLSRPRQELLWGWLTVAPDEDDPHSLLLYLRAALLETGAQLDLERFDALVRQGFAGAHWRAAVDALLSLTFWQDSKFWLVIDDLHQLQGDALALIDYLFRFRPPGLRLLTTGRRTPSDPSFSSWSRMLARGEIGLMGAAELAFTPQDLAGVQLPQVSEWVAATAGWPLAIDLARRGLTALPSESEELLQREFWESLDGAEQELLERCAALDFLAVEECRQLCPDLPVEALLERLRRHGALVQPWSQDSLRLHPLFLDFVRRRLQRDQRRWAQLYQQSAGLLLSQGQLPVSLASALHSPTGLELGQDGLKGLQDVARELLAQGAYERLSRWLESLGPENLGGELRWAYAQALSHSYRFENALSQYALLSQEAEGVERGRSLLAAGRLLVTTVQPERARLSLHKAYKLLPSQERSTVFELLAENCLNLGQARHAERFRQLASRQAPQRDDDSFRLRLLLRTGQIEEARVLAERIPDALPERTEGQGWGHEAQRSAEDQEGHRDRELVLAYLFVLEGLPQPAEILSRRALRSAREKGSIFSEAVALMRLGHALQLQSDADPGSVLNCYEEAAQLADAMGATRLKAEAHMGRALFHAGRGEVAQSYQYSLDGLELARTSGDAWLTAWMRLCVAISAMSGEHPDAVLQLEMAHQELSKVRDRFGLCLVGLWRSLRSPKLLPAAAEDANSAGLRFLLQRITFFGPRRLPESWASPTNITVVEQDSPPLRICLLGPLKIYRAGQELPAQAFKRRKARELLGLLLAQRGQPLSKERLWDLLFPDNDADRAARDLRVALHALFDVLDPDRPHNSPARWVTRRDDLYSIPWSPELSLDWRDYEHLLELAESSRGQREGADSAHHWETALQLVHGELLFDFSGCDWALSLREGWKTSYLVTATKLANYYLEQNNHDQCLALAHTILVQESTWEAGYRLLMEAHLREGRAAQATRVYDLCSEVLQQELGVEPSEDTEALYARALNS